MTLRLYSDGSCLTHGWKLGGPGGWAYIGLDAAGQIVVPLNSAAVRHTTSTEMEIVAATLALHGVEPRDHVTLLTDCMTIPLIVAAWNGREFERGKHSRKMPKLQRKVWHDLVLGVGRHGHVEIVYLESRDRRLDQHAAHHWVHDAAKSQARGMNDQRWQNRDTDTDWHELRSGAWKRLPKVQRRLPESKPIAPPHEGLSHSRECEYGRCVSSCAVWLHYGPTRKALRDSGA